jgi:hypothetical protein
MTARARGESETARQHMVESLQQNAEDLQVLILGRPLHVFYSPDDVERDHPRDVLSA